MRKFLIVMAAAAAVLICGLAQAQNQPDSGTSLSSFYGDKNIQQVNIGYAPSVGPGGGVGEVVSFKFDTISKRSERARNFQNYNGVSLDLRATQGLPNDFSRYGEREAQYYYGMVNLDGRIFYDDRAKVRPYAGLLAGIGWGAINMDKADHGERALQSNRYSVYRVGAEAGVQFMLDKEWGLVLGGDVGYEYSIISNDSFGAYPISGFIGISRWMGPMAAKP